MRNAELVIRELLFQAMEKKQRVLTQSELSTTLSLSLSIVNSAVKKLESLGAVDIRSRSLHIVDPKKILYYWASIRNIQKDIVYSTRVEKPVRLIEKEAPANTTFTAFTAYKLRYHDVPADYSEVYLYGDETARERYPLRKGTPNVFILKKDKLADKYGSTATIAQTFVDLWNLKEWYAKEFVNAMEVKLNGVLE